MLSAVTVPSLVAALLGVSPHSVSRTPTYVMLTCHRRVRGCSEGLHITKTLFFPHVGEAVMGRERIVFIMKERLNVYVAIKKKDLIINSVFFSSFGLFHSRNPTYFFLALGPYCTIGCALVCIFKGTLTYTIRIYSVF